MRKLGRPTPHRISMLRTMACQLIRHQRIETTITRAKELRRYADHMVTLGKEGTLHARRKAAAIVRGEDVLHKLFTEMAARYKHRDGGYTRILRTRVRAADAAPMAFIELIKGVSPCPADNSCVKNLHIYVDRPGELRPARRPDNGLSLLPKAAQAAVRN